MPIASEDQAFLTQYQDQKKEVRVMHENGQQDIEDSMLVRPRKSRIYYNNHLFDYPLKLNINTILGIGFVRGVKIFFSLVWRKLFPINDEKSLEDFYVNRFGGELYRTFFKDYTYKVWGKHCHEISAEWGRQRVKGLGIRRILKHYINTLFFPSRMKAFNKNVEQRLTEFFLYPAKGPGHMWEKVSEAYLKNGVEILLNHRAKRLSADENVSAQKIERVEVLNVDTNASATYEADYVLSSMPVKNLIDSMSPIVPTHVHDVSRKLEYRDFLIVGLLCRDLELYDKDKHSIQDNWLYIQDGSVDVGRVQCFHNWSPFMTNEPETYWIGAEYFCMEGDDLWQKSETDLVQFAALELEKVGLIRESDVLDGTVVRMPKAYPSYVGEYNNFDVIKTFTDSVDNLFLVGRNGMHK